MRTQTVQSASRPSCQAGQSGRSICMALTAHARGRERTAPRERAFRAHRSTIGTDVHILEARGWSSPVTHRRAPGGRARPAVSGQSLAGLMNQTAQIIQAWTGRLPSP